MSATAFAAESGGIGGKPANPRADNPRTQSIFVYTLTPNQSATDAVEVYNNTDTVKNISVYATDSVVSSGGAFACAQAADPVKDVGGWIKLDKNTLTLQPNTNEKVGFTVTAPAYAEPGEHNGCIAIQESDAAAANVGNGIALSFRSAMRVAITVPGAITKELTIRDVSLKEKADKLVGTVLLRNGGNVSLDTAIDAKLKSILGNTAQTITGTYPALPQTITELNFEYNKPFWGGLYRLDVSAAYNSNISEALGEGAAKEKIQKQSSYVYITPKPMALIIELAILGAIVAGIWLVWQRFVVRPRTIKEYKDYIVQNGDDIQSIAVRAKVDWKHIAKVNKLKAPYLLKKGDVLKLPGKHHLSAGKAAEKTDAKTVSKKQNTEKTKTTKKTTKKVE